MHLLERQERRQRRRPASAGSSSSLRFCVCFSFFFCFHSPRGASPSVVLGPQAEGVCRRSRLGASRRGEFVRAERV